MLRKRANVRATRTAGQLTRSRLLDVASGLFKKQRLSGVSIAAIAEAADAFPSQITYYFHTKEALFVEAACRGILDIAERFQGAGALAHTPDTYVSALVDNVLGTNELMLFVEALVLSGKRPDLASQIACTLERLHVDGARAFRGELSRRGWHTSHAPEVVFRKFWALALGVALGGQGMGRSAAEMSAAMSEALGEIAQAP